MRARQVMSCTPARRVAAWATRRRRAARFARFRHFHFYRHFAPIDADFDEHELL